MGLDLSNGTIRNNLEAGVIEPATSKVKIIQVKVMALAEADQYRFCFILLTNFYS